MCIDVSRTIVYGKTRAHLKVLQLWLTGGLLWSITLYFHTISRAYTMPLHSPTWTRQDLSWRGINNVKSGINKLLRDSTLVFCNFLTRGGTDRWVGGLDSTHGWGGRHGPPVAVWLWSLNEVNCLQHDVNEEWRTAWAIDEMITVII